MFLLKTHNLVDHRKFPELIFLRIFTLECCSMVASLQGKKDMREAQSWRKRVIEEDSRTERKREEDR